MLFKLMLNHYKLVVDQGYLKVLEILRPLVCSIFVHYIALLLQCLLSSFPTPPNEQQSLKHIVLRF